MHIREAVDEELDVVADLRLRFLAEHRGIDASDLPPAFRQATRAYLRRHAEAGTIRSWLAAAAGGVDVGIVTMLLLDLPPRPGDLSGTEGYIVNMYVAPAHRRRGLGGRLLEACLAAAGEARLRRVVLHATDDGAPLYAGAGFAADPRWMELRP